MIDIDGVTYRTVKLGRGKLVHLSRDAQEQGTYCGREIAGVWYSIESVESAAVCDNCDKVARASREGRTL